MNMAEPVDAIRAFHHAFRNDLEHIDTATYNSAKGKEGLTGTIERYRFFNEMLVWHAKGEEVGVFPIVETVAPWLLKRMCSITMASTRPMKN